MKERTNIKHKTKDKCYCTETLDQQHWGGDDVRLTCHKCGFAKIVHVSLFLKWRYCDEVE